MEVQGQSERMCRAQAGFRVRNNRISPPGPSAGGGPSPQRVRAQTSRVAECCDGATHGELDLRKAWDERRLAGEGNDGLNLEGCAGAGRRQRSGRVFSAGGKT